MARDRHPHIGIFGRRNFGKSTLLNKLTGQEVAIVSEVAGTTTDPVRKSYEITHFGPVIWIDTAGIDDEGELGEKRVGKTLEVLKIIDLAILVLAHNCFGEPELLLIQGFQKYDVPFIVVHNREDEEVLSDELVSRLQVHLPATILRFDFHCRDMEPMVQAIKMAIPESAYTVPSLLGPLIQPLDVVLLVTPIDREAPEGRLILPQVQAIRDVLDNDAICVVVKEDAISPFLSRSGMVPALAVTDSQAFEFVGKTIPQSIPLTSFSIMLANFKGNFTAYRAGTPRISELKAGNRVLILESCSHHVACDDIGRFKIPNWLQKFTGQALEFDVVSGLNSIPRSPNEYAMVIQCGGCMVTRKQLLNRLKPFVELGIPVTNYGMAIAYLKGIYERAMAPFAVSEAKTPAQSVRD